jgi:hypothetical protein
MKRPDTKPLAFILQVVFLCNVLSILSVNIYDILHFLRQLKLNHFGIKPIWFNQDPTWDIKFFQVQKTKLFSLHAHRYQSTAECQQQ